jgi:TetR/AcrR family transcriptional regulator, regulator of mycofactocin system
VIEIARIWHRVPKLLNDLDPDVPIGDALRTALLVFNSFDERETARHRQRMRVILQTAALQAYSMTMYAGWRAVVAAFVARRLGTKAADLVPQTVALTMLGVALSADEHWLADESVSLSQALGDSFDTVSDGLRALD